MHAHDKAEHEKPVSRSVRAAGETPHALLALQRAAGNAAVTEMVRRSTVPDVVRSAGRPLDESTRTEMEERLGADFSDVRLHNDPAARRSAAELGARAYTSGSHVVIGDGGGDRHTLAHELTHVIQQRNGPVAGTDRGDGLAVSDPGDAFERAAEANATRVMRAPATSGHRHTVQRMLAPESEAGPSNEKKPAVLIHPDYASGDQFAVAAVLVNEPDRHVFITHRDASTADAEKIRKFHLESGVGEERVHVVPAAQVDERLRQHHGADVWDAASRTDQRKEEVFRTEVGGATRRVAATAGEGMREKVRQGWGLNTDGEAAHEKDAQVKAWLKTKGVSKVTGTNIAILWSRFSGKKGEVHLEHDTSYLGMAQIIAGLGTLDYVLIVGDSGRQKNSTKFAEIADNYNSGASAPERMLKRVTTLGEDPKKDVRRYYSGFKAKVVDLTEFWNEPAVKEWGGDDRPRTGQFLLFDYLNRRGKARHLGFRSGNLEAMALMGFTVRYMEEPDSEGGTRMAAWHDTGEGRTSAGGEAPGYERFLVDAPPTRSGQHELTLGTDARRERQHDRDLRTPKKEPDDKRVNDRSRPKGFSDTSLETIDAYLVHGDPAHGLKPELVEQVKKLEKTVAATRYASAKKAAVKAANETKARQQAQAGYTRLAAVWQEGNELRRAANIFAPTVVSLLAHQPTPSADPGQPGPSNAPG